MTFRYLKIFIISLLMTIVVGRVSAAVLFSEDFQNASGVAQTAFNDLFHTGGVEQNLIIAPEGDQGNKVLRWTRENSYYYYVRTNKILESSTGRISISFRTKFDKTYVYQWQFVLDDPTHQKPYLTLHVPGIGNDADWGKLRYDTGGGVLYSMCQIKTGWKTIRIDVDFTRQTADVYYDNMKVPVGVDLPLHNLPKSGQVHFTPSFTGVSSIKEGYFDLDDFVITDISPLPKYNTLSKQKPQYLRDNVWELQISSDTGALLSARKQGKSLLFSGDDVYKLESRKSEGFAREDTDKVTKIIRTQRSIKLECTNTDFPGIIVYKTYTLLPDGQFSKMVAFHSISTEGFITWVIRNDAPDSVVQAKYPNTTIGFYRYQVNNRFVLPVQGMMIRVNGWDQTVFCDYVKNGQTCSSQIRYFAYNSDPVVKASFLASVPDYQKIFTGPKPGWIDNMVTDTMYLTSDTPTFMNQITPLTATATIWFLNPPWGNWWSYSDPPKSLHPNPAGICEDMRKAAPNGRFSAYANMLFDINSDVYKHHPEMAVYDRAGQMMDSGIPSDSGGVTTYYTNIGRPETKAYWLDMYLEKVKNWKMDFLYSDGPGTLHEVQDWKYLDVVQSSNWLDYYKELHQRLRKLSPETAFFSNGVLPYSDMGYIEWRDAQWQQLVSPADWRSIARSLLLLKASEPAGYLMIPTYGTDGAQPAISTYSIAYGWCGHGNSIQRLPWMLAALEYRYMRLIPQGISPNWWLTGGKYEAYAFAKGEDRIFSVVSHSEDMTAQVRLRPLALRIKPGKYLLRTLLMNNPVNSVSTLAFSESDCRYIQVSGNEISLTVPVKNGLLTSLILSPEFAIVENNGARTSETGITSCYAMKITRITSRIQLGNTRKYIVKTFFPNSTIFFPGAAKVTSPDSGIIMQRGNRGKLEGVRINIPQAGDNTIEVSDINGPSAK